MHMLNMIKEKVKIYLPDIILFFATVLVFNLFFPYNISNIPTLKKGDIASRDIIAPFTFDLLKNEDVLKRERQSAYDNVPPILIFDDKKTSTVLSEPDRLKDVIDSLNRNVWKYPDRKAAFLSVYPQMSEEMADILLVSDKGSGIIKNVAQWLKSTLEKGVIADKGAIPFGKDRRITIKRDGKELNSGENEILAVADAIESVKESVIKQYSANSFLLKFGLRLYQEFLRPNLSIDIEETTLRREKAKNEVPEKIGVILKGEIIVRAHDIVDQSVEDKLISLQKQGRRSHDPLYRFLRFMTKNMIFLIIIILYMVFVNLTFPHLKITYKDKILSLALFMLNMMLYGLFYQFEYIEYILPLVVTVMMFSLLYSRTYAVVSLAFIISSLIIYSGMRMYGLLAVMITAVYSIYLIRQIDRRMQFIPLMLKTAVVIVPLAICIEVFRESSFLKIVFSALFGFLNAIVSTVLLLVVMPAVEKMTGRITKISLIELSDLNHPLLKMLGQKTSGTFHHSLIVSNLAESGAREIGADEILARVGGYFHDIGKVEKPEYFIENQSSLSNPHESLPPELSSDIIREHITNGEKLAVQYRLPNAVIEIIRSHHGDSTLDYFLEKAKQKNPQTDESKFRYEGPKPRSKEAAIVMLADSVEAAVRSIQNLTEKDIEAMINRIFYKRLTDGQLNESELSMKDLERLKEVFLFILKGIYHPRVVYTYENEK